MLKLMDKNAVIKLKLVGASDRKVSRETGINRKTVAKYWKEYLAARGKLPEAASIEDLRGFQEQITEPPKYDSSTRGPRKYTEEIDALVDEILRLEEEKDRKLGPHKQKLTLVQIHEIVKANGYDIGRSTLSEYVRIKRDKKKEVFIKQEYEYGERAEYDFGEVKLEIGGVVGKYYMALFASPAGSHRWAFLYTNQKKEVFMDSHIRYFEMQGGVYHEIVYDNMKNVVTKFIGRNEKELNEDLIKMSLYYEFEINVTNCFSGNEKGYVESSVKKLRNEIFAKRYSFETLEEAEDYMHEMLTKINAKSSKMEEERKYLLPYKPPLEIGKLTTQKVNKYSFIQVETNFYSVPEHLVGEWVKVKIYPKEIMVYSNARLVARHKKIDGSREIQADIYHYLDTLARKPGALKNSKALKSKAELKTIYDKYFTKRPLDFIALLRINEGKNTAELLEILEEAGKNSPGNVIILGESSKVEESTREQLRILSEMYRKGGLGYVN